MVMMFRRSGDVQSVELLQTGPQSLLSAESSGNIRISEIEDSTQRRSFAITTQNVLVRYG